MSKKSFVLYNDSLDVLDDMSQEEVACMFLAIRDYNKGKEPELMDSLKFLFKQFKNQFDRDAEKWATTCAARAKAGSKGGKQKVANASKCKQKVAKVAILADNDTVNENENENEKKNKGKAKSMEEVIEFCESINLTKADGEIQWDKWEGNGWMNGKGKIKDWKATIRSWKRQGYMPSQQNPQLKNNFTPIEFAPIGEIEAY